MSFITNEGIKTKQEQGAQMYKLDCGWTLSSQTLAQIAIALSKWEPKTETEKRDKHICELAFIKNMNAAQIKRLNDPLIVGMGNRSKGKPLSETSILAICYKYFPEAKQRRGARCSKRTQSYRNEVLQGKRANTIKAPVLCATCGSEDKLELHHIIPLSAGGTNDYFNLLYLCHDCHMKLHHCIYDNVHFLIETS